MDKKTPLTKAQQIALLNRHIDNMLEGVIPFDADIVMKYVDKILELEGVKLPPKRVIRKGQRQLRRKMKQQEKELYQKINNE